MKQTVNIIHPFSLDKHYGVELNKAMSRIPSGEWACIMDWDCMLLDHRQVSMMTEYISAYPETGMFLALSNRSGSVVQRYKGQLSGSTQMTYWHRIAMNIKPSLKYIPVPNNHISGFLMLISKDTWDSIKFNEDLKILDVDRDYAARLLNNGKDIKIMSDVVVYHSYRLWSPGNKDHLV